MTETILAGVALGLAAVPALLFLWNLFLYRPPPDPEAGATPPRLSVLIPARNEEATIEQAVRAALASEGVDLEVVVLDDHSTDRTAEIVRRIAEADPRVRLELAPPLPEGWCGKQHACQALAGLARMPLLLFQDADVRLAPHGAARLAAFLERSGADLVSGFPYQATGSLFEQMLIPLIHFILLGFLPMWMMRRSGDASFGAGCGQLFLARREAYREMGGHETIRATLHDGIKLPRAFRSAGKKTDLCDATGVATCRMYDGAYQTWQGLAKNATEGLASPGAIVPATMLLGGGQVLPFVLLAFWPLLPPLALWLAGAAALLAYWPRIAGVVAFRQPLVGAALHPVGVALLLAIQWHALGRAALGLRAGWRGRTYPA